MSGRALLLLGLLPAAARAGADDAFQKLVEGQGQPVAATFTVAVPHPELRVSAEGFRITPALGLRSEASFAAESSTASRASGQLALLAEEVPRTAAAAAALGFSTGPAHAHFLHESPRVVFLHVSAAGSMDDLTERWRRLTDDLRKRRVAAGLQPGPTRLENGLEKAKLERALGAPAEEDEGALRFALPYGGSAAFAGGMDKALVVGLLRRGTLPSKSVLQTVSSAPGELRFQAVGPAAELAAAVAAAVKEKAPGP